MNNMKIFIIDFSVNYFLYKKFRRYVYKKTLKNAKQRIIWNCFFSKFCFDTQAWKH